MADKDKSCNCGCHDSQCRYFKDGFYYVNKSHWKKFRDSKKHVNKPEIKQEESK